MATAVGTWGAGQVWLVTGGVFPSNAYVCEMGRPGDCIVVDCGIDGPALDAELSALGLRPQTIFCTHGHFDHIGGAAHLQQKYGCPVFLHRADERTMKASNFLMMALKIPLRITLPEVTWVSDDQIIDVAGHALRFLAAPGHTPGSCVIEFGGAWFTGDTLYSHGIVLSRLPGEDREKLKASIHALWPRLTGQRAVYPGHGKASDGLAIRTRNQELLDFLGLSSS